MGMRPPFVAGIYPDTGQWLVLETPSTPPDPPDPGDLSMYPDGYNWWELDGTTQDLRCIIGGDPAVTTGSDDMIPYFDGPGRVNVDAGLKFNPTYGLVVNDASGSAVDFRVETNSNDHAVFVDASADAVIFGSSTIQTVGDITSDTFVNIYRDAADNSTTELDAATIILNSDVSSSVAAKYCALSVGIKVDIANGVTVSAGGFVAGQFVDARMFAADSFGTLPILEGIQSFTGHESGANSPTTTSNRAFHGIVQNEKGTITHQSVFRASDLGGAGTTYNKYIFHAPGSFAGDAIYGILIGDGANEVWNFTAITTLAGNHNDWDIGNGRNYEVDLSVSNSNIHGIRVSASVSNVDGQEIYIYNKDAGTDTITFKHNSGSASAGNTIYSTSGGDIVLNPGEVFHAIWNATKNGWLAWKN